MARWLKEPLRPRDPGRATELDLGPGDIALKGLRPRCLACPSIMCNLGRFPLQSPTSIIVLEWLFTLKSPGSSPRSPLDLHPEAPGVRGVSLCCSEEPTGAEREEPCQGSLPSLSPLR